MLGREQQKWEDMLFVSRTAGPALQDLVLPSNTNFSSAFPFSSTILEKRNKQSSWKMSRGTWERNQLLLILLLSNYELTPNFWPSYILPPAAPFSVLQKKPTLMVSRTFHVCIYFRNTIGRLFLLGSLPAVGYR